MCTATGSLRSRGRPTVRGARLPCGWQGSPRRRRSRRDAMAWDFSTEPEFEEQLEWMRTFVRDEIFPLETLDLDDEATWRRLTDPLKQQVKDRGLWAAHLDPELGGQGFGQVK